ncbi:hypothetical protein GCM10010492_37090 [Saccharothrix mutabilis subsp. mutabilis]|uniref:Uncharacterized protein n=1 Tax=Saccharothrix mutabilis subsp. mutabilis TaxID=66855 RepID=A0ABN0U0I9_9PSEU
MSGCTESLTVQVRAGLGEWRLHEAVRALAARHPELTGATSSARHVDHRDLSGHTAAALASAEARASVLQVVWLDGGSEGRLVLVARREVLALLPWHVLLPELVAEWKAATLRDLPQPAPA